MLQAPRASTHAHKLTRISGLFDKVDVRVFMWDALLSCPFRCR
jgi:hypothetical protein